MVDLYDPNVDLLTEARASRDRIRRRRAARGLTGPVPPGPTAPMLSPEHYHLTYTSLESGREVPDFRRGYPRQRLAYMAVARKAALAGENVEYYEDGRVMVETRLPGRTGLHRIVIAVGACMAKQCRPLQAVPSDQAPASDVVLSDRQGSLAGRLILP